MVRIALVLNATVFVTLLGKGNIGCVEQSDGIRQEAQGTIKNAGTDNEALEVKGSYSYVGPDGKTYEVKYTADEEGYHPEGEHLPPSAGVKKLGIPASGQASLIGGGLG
ncbi:hypothetical protein NQ318_014237 [Aromia moschata]|uniref:Uncharacterized protein n=1 Tax=Aromia moschata TaxID=1265417 RepID=A0AAV8Z020_9CUCU|nr:hypothetical protein NQ318_014237 [Aromia moschata]